MKDNVTPNNEPTFQSDLTALINRYSRENESNTPDFLLSYLLVRFMSLFADIVKDRDRWYGDDRWDVQEDIECHGKPYVLWKNNRGLWGFSTDEPIEFVIGGFPNKDIAIERAQYREAESQREAAADVD